MRWTRLFVVSFAAVSILAACGGSNIDARRLHVLSNDPLTLATAPGTTPWIPAVDTPEHIEANGSAGSGDGIGFGGTSPTLVQVTRHLNGSSEAALLFYAETAIRNGWRTSKINCSAFSDSFSASKQFPGFVASAVVGAGRVFRNAPAVTLNIETNYHGGNTPGVLPKVDVHWLTVHDLASTCIGGSP